MSLPTLIILVKGVAILAVLGAIISWIVAFSHAFRAVTAERAAGRHDVAWMAVFAWPFAVRRMTGHAAQHAAIVHKAMVAFFTAVLVLAASSAVISNLERISTIPPR
jgi:hypothetical protein